LYEVIYVNFAFVFLSFAAILLVYMLFRRAFSVFAYSELRKSGCARFCGGAVELFARGESLEYLLRLALALPDVNIRVYIAEGDEEAACIAEIMGRFYDFEIIEKT
jgi:hypothetical protein